MTLAALERLDDESFPIPSTEALQQTVTWLEAELEQDDVAPDAVQLPDPLPDADLAEAERAVEAEARAVVGEDARLERPEPAGPRAVDQRLQQRPANAAAPAARCSACGSKRLDAVEGIH